MKIYVSDNYIESDGELEVESGEIVIQVDDANGMQRVLLTIEVNDDLSTEISTGAAIKTSQTGSSFELSDASLRIEPMTSRQIKLTRHREWFRK